MSIIRECWWVQWNMSGMRVSKSTEDFFWHAYSKSYGLKTYSQVQFYTYNDVDVTIFVRIRFWAKEAKKLWFFKVQMEAIDWQKRQATPRIRESKPRAMTALLELLTLRNCWQNVFERAAMGGSRPARPSCPSAQVRQVQGVRLFFDWQPGWKTR